MKNILTKFSKIFSFDNAILMLLLMFVFVVTIVLTNIYIIN